MKKTFDFFEVEGEAIKSHIAEEQILLLKKIKARLAEYSVNEETQHLYFSDVIRIIDSFQRDLEVEKKIAEKEVSCFYPQNLLDKFIKDDDKQKKHKGGKNVFKKL